MRFYLALATADPRAPIPAHVLDGARRLADLVLPVPEGSLRHTTWSAPNGNVALLAWTNEPDHSWLPDPLVRLGHGGDAGVLGYPGYLADARDLQRLCTATDLGATVDATAGSFGVFRAAPDGVDAVTSITRTDPVYYCQRAGLHVAGNRAVLAHLTARTAEEGEGAPLPPTPEYDIAPMHILVRQGYYMSDDTPFAGLRTLPELATLRIRDGRASVLRRDLPQPEPAPATPRQRRRQVARLADALLASVEPVREHSEGISLSLTGGRDSRLVAAVLHAAGIPFRASTRGFADHPDVVLARRICAELGIEDHHVTEPQRDGSDSVLVEHPFPRTLRLIRMTEGMNSAFEQVIAPPAFLMEARLSGSGGEALRGGWLNDQRDLNRDSLLKRLRTVTLAQSAVMTPEANARAHELFQQFHTMCEPDFPLGLDRLFLKFRSGRWLPGSRTATLIGYCMYHPFLDHRVRWEAMSLSPTWRWSEGVVHELLAHLAPPLARMPIADRPWRFDHRRVYNPLHRIARRSRPALRARTTVGGFDWRRKLGPEYVAPMRERILDTPELFRLIDRSQAERILTEDPPTRPNQIWNLYTIALLLSDEWLPASVTAPATDPRPDPVRIPIR